MTEADYISALQAAWPRQHTDKVSAETLALADEAVRVFPQSPRLWVMRGDLIQLGAESTPRPLEDALICYQRAVAIDPAFAEGWEEIGRYHVVVHSDEEAAQKYFREAERLKAQRSASGSDI